MAYEPQTWTNDDPETPLSAERMTHIEEGIEAADEKAEDNATAIADLLTRVEALEDD